MKNEIPIMFCFDKNYVIQASVAFYSLLEHANKKFNYLFYVLHTDICKEQQDKLQDTIKEFKNCKLEFINMSNKFDELWNKIYRGDHFSKEVMYKILPASIFPKLDKIIVSDVDVVFLDDISDSFFEISTEEDAYIAGVKPIGKIKSYLQVYNAQWNEEEREKMGNICGGYLVMNLKKIREDNYEEVFIKFFEENGYRLNQMEQDIFNITCYGKLKHLHLKYVACSYMWDYYKTQEDINTDENYSSKEIKEAMNNPVQLHYATGIKPWKNVDCTKSEEWFKYLVKTPFIKEYLKQLPYNIILPEERLSEIANNNVKEEIQMKKSNNIFSRSFRTIKKIIKKIIK